MTDPGAQQSARRKIRLLLLNGLVALVALLVGLGLFAVRSLNELTHGELSTTREYLRRTEQLENVQGFLVSATRSVRDYILEPNEAGLPAHRQRARRAWSHAAASLRQYTNIAPDRRDLTSSLESQLSRYWAAAEMTFLFTGPRREESGINVLFRTLTPMRDEFLATVAEIGALDRARIMAEAEKAEILVRKEEAGLWIAIAVASFLALAVSLLTFRHLMRLEQVAADQYQVAVRTAGELQRLAERILNVQEEERRKIARDLHDDYGQRMASLIFELSRVNDRPDLSPELRAATQTMTERVESLAKDLQQMSRGLHSAVLEKIGLAAAIRSDCEALAKRSHLDIAFTAHGVPRRLPDSIALALYRISQEAVQNALKHSHTNRMEVSLEIEDENLVLRVRDFGRGFDTSAGGGGLGLVSIRERLRAVGGTSVLSSEAGNGTTVEARVPLSSTFDRKVVAFEANC